MKARGLWTLVLGAVLFAPGSVWAQNEALQGVTVVRPFMARLSSDAEKCGLTTARLSEAFRQPLREGGVTFSETAKVYFYVNVTTIYLESQKYCVSSVGLEAYTRQYLNLEATGKNVPATVLLWESGVVFGSPEDTHGNEVEEALVSRATVFTAKWKAAQS